MERSAFPVVPLPIPVLEITLRPLADRPCRFARFEMMQILDGNGPKLRAPFMPGDEQAPGWARGLRQLYQPVADEPIPSDFDELLARFDHQSAPRSSH